MKGKGGKKAYIQFTKESQGSLGCSLRRENEKKKAGGRKGREKEEKKKNRNLI